MTFASQSDKHLSYNYVCWHISSLGQFVDAKIAGREVFLVFFIDLFFFLLVSICAGC